MDLVRCSELVAQYTEVQSAKRIDRPEFTIAADNVDLVNTSLLVSKLERLSRDLHFVTSLQKRSIRFSQSIYDKFCDLQEIDISSTQQIKKHIAPFTYRSHRG